MSHLTAKTLALYWHDNSAPIYSITSQPRVTDSTSLRLVTGGGDNNVRIWSLNYKDDKIDGVEYRSTISKHTQAINCVRFNKYGDLLATASDDGTIMIWKKSETIVKDFGQEDDEEVKESWIMKVTCFSNNMSEIYDICWSPDGKFICCGLMDNIIRIFSTTTGSMVKQIAEHNHYVQGVTWDPKGEFICSQSADRSVHVYKVSIGENGELNVGPTAFYKSIKSELPTGRLSQVPRLTIENLIKNNDNTTQTKDSLVNYSQSYSNTATGAPTPSTTVVSTPILGSTNLSLPPNNIPMLRAGSNSTTMEPPNQTPRHKRTHSNSSTTSSHRCASPLPAVMPSSPSLKHSEMALPLTSLNSINQDSKKNISNAVNYKQNFLYHGETLQSFFRRLTFSPDGALLLTTSGMYKQSSIKLNQEEITNTVYVYTRGGINKPPIVHIPGFKKPAIGIQFSPVKYSLLPSDNESDSQNVFNLPYRMLFAIATQDSILIYDTQRLKCVGIATNLHYAVITDICWCSDGKSIFASSSDGFVSSVVLSEEIVGGEIIGNFDDDENENENDGQGITVQGSKVEREKGEDHLDVDEVVKEGVHLSHSEQFKENFKDVDQNKTEASTGSGDVENKGKKRTIDELLNNS